MYIIEAFVRTCKPPLSLMLICEISEFFKAVMLLSSVNLVSCYWHDGKVNPSPETQDPWDPLGPLRSLLGPQRPLGKVSSL